MKDASYDHAQHLAERVRDTMLATDRVAQTLGMQVSAISPGHASVTMVVREDMLNGFGSCHGGLLATLADMAFAYACNSYNEMTVGLRLRRRPARPGKLGETLTADAREVSQGARMGVWRHHRHQPAASASRFPRPLVATEGAGRPDLTAPPTETNDARQRPAPASSNPSRPPAATNSRPCSCSALQWSLRHAYENVPHYQRAFDAKGVHPSIRNRWPISRSPFTTKKELRENYPFGMFAVPRQQVVRIHASRHHRQAHRGGLHAGDIDRWADLVARSIRASGGAPATSCTWPTATACSPAGWARTTAPRSLGCTVIPMSGGRPRSRCS